MTDQGPPNLESRFAGAMLGTMVGDQLGASFEGQSPDVGADLRMNSGQDAAGWIAASRYTDDTQMMIGVAESLAAIGRFDGPDMARRFAENYEPYRGYGSGAGQVLAALRAGCAWDQAATLVFPDGSFGNGAAMRVAPIGLFHYDDLPELRRVAELSASITHSHPLGMEGTVLQARAVAEAVRSPAAKLDSTVFLTGLRTYVRGERDEFLRSFGEMTHLLECSPSVSEIVSVLGHDIRAHRSVPAAIYAFLAHPESFADAVQSAVMLGGDTDTIGAMTGAIAGAYGGVEAIPHGWIDALENTAKGRDYVLTLAARLHDWHIELLGTRRCADGRANG